MRFSRMWMMALGMMMGTTVAMAQTTQPATQPATEPAQEDVASAELMDNPQFEAWKKFGIGSTQTMESTVLANGQQMKMTTTQELLEKKSDEITLNISAEMEISGQKQVMPPQRQNVPAKAPNQEMNKIGNEQVTAAGETFDATVYEMEAGNGMKAKVWFSEKVPGGVVQVTMEGPQGNLKGELKKYEAK